MKDVRHWQVGGCDWSFSPVLVIIPNNLFHVHKKTNKLQGGVDFSIGERAGVPGEQAEGKVRANGVAGLVAGHEIEPARGLGDEMQRGHEHERVALHATPQDAHCQAEVVEVRQPQ